MIILGNSLSKMHPLIQWYEYTGVLGGTLWIVIINVLLLKSLEGWKLKTLSISFILPIVISIVLYWVISDSYIKKTVLVIHPNIDCFNEKYNKPTESIIEDHISLTAAKMSKDIDYIIWPETTITNSTFIENLDIDPSISRIRKFLENYPKTKLITGIISFKRSNTKNSSKYSSEYNVYYSTLNGAIEIGKNLSTSSSFRTKNKLVPFEEYTPFPSILSRISKHIKSMGGFNFSWIETRRPIFHGNNDRILTLICYESAYGQYIAKQAALGAKCIFILLNEGWYQNSAGASQFLELARLRAIETRKYVARSSNFGISSIINHKGDVLAKSAFMQSYNIKERVSLIPRNTIYSIFGDYIPFIALLIGIIRLYTKRFFK